MTEPKPTEAEITAVLTANRCVNDELCKADYEFATCSLCRSRALEILAALAAARSPAPKWRPTHRHYKGGLYRKLGEGIHTVTREKLTFYENAKGDLFVLPTAMFNGAFDQNGLHFMPLPSPPKETT